MFGKVDEGPNKLDNTFSSLLVKEDSGWKVFNPSMNKGRTLFRPWGTIVNGRELPWRDGEGKLASIPSKADPAESYTHFFIKVSVCYMWGMSKNKFTACLECSDPFNWNNIPPFKRFYQTLRQMPAFADMVERRKDTNIPPVVQAPDLRGFLKGLMIENANKQFNKRPIYKALFILPNSALKAFLKLLDKRTPPGTPIKTTEMDPHGWDSQYEVGNPISAAQGKIFEFNDAKKLLSTGNVTVNLDDAVPAEDSSGGWEGKLYGVQVLQALPIPLERIAKYDATFEDIINYLSGKEQITTLETAFADYRREALIAAFGGTGHLSKQVEFAKTTSIPTKPAGGPTIPSVSNGVAPAPVVAGGLDINMGDELDGEATVEQPNAPTPVAPLPMTQPSGDVKALSDDIKRQLAALQAAKVQK